jgi:hypothetical protein
MTSSSWAARWPATVRRVELQPGGEQVVTCDAEGRTETARAVGD